MKRFATILAAVWALAFVPTLCMGGLLPHGCDRAAASGCEHESNLSHESEPSHETDCSHESDCSADPCAQIAVCKNLRSNDYEIVFLTLAACDASFSAGLTNRFPDSPQKVSVPPLRINLPFPVSDVPLLI